MRSVFVPSCVAPCAALRLAENMQKQVVSPTFCDAMFLVRSQMGRILSQSIARNTVKCSPGEPRLLVCRQPAAGSRCS